jgi:hypothetical protein
MNTSFSKDKERLALLKIAYFEALASYDKSYTEEALTSLRASESAIQDFIKGYEVSGIV